MSFTDKIALIAIITSCLSLLSAWAIPFFLAWWNSKPRVDFGFLRGKNISNKMSVSRTEVTPITFIMKNKTKKRIEDLYFDIEIWRPLSLSDTNRAVHLFTGEAGRTLVVQRDGKVFHIRHIIPLAPEEQKRISIELNTGGNQPDIYPIDMTFSSPKHNFKRKVLKIEII